MSESDPYQANVQRGAQLLRINRPIEAAKYFQEAIAVSPRSAHAYAQLARCWNEIPSERRKVLPAIDQAIALAPTTSACFAMKSWFLLCQGKSKEALAVAQHGIELNPLCAHSLSALANAYSKIHDWNRAEMASRRILEINPNDSIGLNLLAQALRNEGRWRDSNEVVARILANMPNDSFGHANAGFSALRAGDHFRANQHFLEALRLDPQSENARRGLLESYLTRSRFARFSMRLAVALTSPKAVRQSATVVAIGSIYLFVALVTPLVDPKASTLGEDVFAIVFLLPLIFWLFGRYLRAVACFLLMFNPAAWNALTAKEKTAARLPLFAIVGTLVLLAALQRWLLVAVVGVFTFSLVLTIQLPEWKDRWTLFRSRRSGN